MDQFKNRTPVLWNYDALVDAEPLAAYRAFADTDRFNRLSGGNRLKIEERPVAPGVVERRLHESAGEVFIEEPFQWEEGRYFSVVRHYEKGPLLGYRWHQEFAPEGEGSRLTFRVELYVRSKWLRPLVGLVARWGLKRKVRETLEAAVPFESTGRLPAALRSDSGVQASRLAHARADLLNCDLPAVVVDSVLRLVRDETDLELLHVKPLEVAAHFGLPVEPTIHAFLHGTRKGYFELRWSLICPSCWGAKGEVEDLARLRLEAHCASCNIVFDGTFEDSVQITFRPAARLRRLEEGYFCVGGPMRTPHIRAQQTLEAGGTSTLLRAWPADWVEPRLRCPAQETQTSLDGPGVYALGDDGFERIADDQGLVVSNTLASAVRLVVEESVLPDTVLTAASIIQMQIFRDLFSEQTLAPDAVVALRPMVFLFTDLQGSTAMYEATGDAAAFAQVQQHFEILLRVLAEHQGILVKTIGDAVMATFDDPVDGMRCAITMQECMREESNMGLKLGMHYGRAMSVTLNGRLDYFGATVNRAARLEGQSLGGDVVCSRSVYDDPGVSHLLKQAGFDLSYEELSVKGVEAPMHVVRVQVVNP